MKILVIGLFAVMPFSAFADLKYCGQLTSVSFQTDIYSVVRMGVLNYDNEPTYITVKDEAAIESVIATVSNQDGYRHLSDMDDYVWDSKEDSNNYFVCVTGTELREYREKFYMDEVEIIDLWKNGIKVE